MVQRQSPTLSFYLCAISPADNIMPLTLFANPNAVRFLPTPSIRPDIAMSLTSPAPNAPGRIHITVKNTTLTRIPPAIRSGHDISGKINPESTAQKKSIPKSMLGIFFFLASTTAIDIKITTNQLLLERFFSIICPLFSIFYHKKKIALLRNLRARAVHAVIISPPRVRIFAQSAFF